MIVYADKGYQTRSDCPSEDWSGGGAKYVVADGSELALKIERLYPNYDFVEEEGELVDVVEVGPPEPSEEEKRFRYEARTVELLRELYSSDDEAKVVREYLAQLEGAAAAFQDYNRYVVHCKQQAALEVYGQTIAADQ